MSTKVVPIRALPDVLRGDTMALSPVCRSLWLSGILTMKCQLLSTATPAAPLRSPFPVTPERALVQIVEGFRLRPDSGTDRISVSAGDYPAGSR